jgi:hypothetical protein
MELWILRFHSYPNALNWLDQTPGVAVTPKDSFRGFRPFCGLLISIHMSECDRATILSCFPSAYKNKLTIHPGDNIQHHSYTIDGTISDIVEPLKALGGVVKNSPCYLNIISEEEGIERLQELSIRAGKDLAQMDYKELGRLYRSLYPS